MVDKIGIPAAYEGVAEEAIELAHAALKTARAWRDENPTPMGFDEGRQKVVEELTHLLWYLNELRILPNNVIYDQVSERFNQRWRDRNCD